MTGQDQPSHCARTAKLSLWDAAFYSLMVGAGETYFAAFLLAAGAGATLAGLTTTVPLLAGALIQYALTRLGRRVPYRRWVVCCATLQSLLFFPLAYFAFRGDVPVATVFATCCLYWGAQMAASPAWNTWIDRLIAGPERARFFAARGRVGQAAVFVGFVAAGVALHQTTDQPLLGFGAIFLGSGLARLLSMLCISRHAEGDAVVSKRRGVSASRFVKEFRLSSGGQLFRFLLAMYGAAYVAAPFFTPFMLTELALSYSQYVMLIAASYLGKVVAYPYLGRMVGKMGASRILFISGVGVMPLSVAWLFSHHFAYLMIMQFIGGVAWAGFELASVLMIFERVDVAERSSVLAHYNLFQSAAIAVGSLVGALLLSSMTTRYEGYLVVFLISSILRGMTLPLLSGATAVKPRALNLVFRVIAVRPSGGFIAKPIISREARRAEAKKTRKAS